MELPTIPTVYRISRPGREPINDVDSVEGAIRDDEPGRIHVDQISDEPPASGHTGHRWGIGIKRPDGTVTIDPDPRPDR
jgi:hypothetical protein